jgi:hypothetical protein
VTATHLPDMSWPHLRRNRPGVVAGITALLLLWGSPSRAQNVTEASLKAALIYNFAKFTEWPRDVLPGTVPFGACVLGDPAIKQELERTVRGRLLTGHSISVSFVTLDGPLRACHLLYVSAVTPTQAVQILTAVRGAPVLTIIDIEGFANRGSVASVFVQSGTMRFDLDHGLAKRSRLQLSSKLLMLADRVHDEPTPVVP